jgi:two-component system, NarL family, sensor histidine kinase DegS
MSESMIAESSEASWDSLENTLEVEIDQTKKNLRAIQLMLDQSAGEIDKLTKRNSLITAQLRKIKGEPNTPVEEIIKTYEAALDAQQRLVVMRSQLEKLQSEQGYLDNQLHLLNNVRMGMSGVSQQESGGGKLENLATAEMMIQAQEAERQRLSRQMHDGPAQTLSNFILQTEIASRLFDVDQVKAREELASLKISASRAFQQVRDFIFDLRPMMLDDLGLVPTIKRYADAFREKSGKEVLVTISGQERRMESYLEVMVFRAIQELLSNALVHSQASQIQIDFDMAIDRVLLVIEDNGVGMENEAKGSKGLGIKLIRDRAEMIGGKFNIESELGQGAKITLILPPGLIENGAININ